MAMSFRCRDLLLGLLRLEMPGSHFGRLTQFDFADITSLRIFGNLAANAIMQKSWVILTTRRLIVTFLRNHWPCRLISLTGETTITSIVRDLTDSRKLRDSSRAPFGTNAHRPEIAANEPFLKEGSRPRPRLSISQMHCIS
jgi:hypothetical protein